ncbi:MAG TPA: hypothetical protein VJS38_17260 [Phenylobacterium sp.]|uniref:hypothetical protein n=1 Tax=Phenylobacterium sp. TaxID=1871053 RepID=UPI002B45CEFC|nr:hypothetical protein [Phenylobacterium sp.]HKR89921.1 hypothetical protein [Phenylobacterium sp.]
MPASSDFELAIEADVLVIGGGMAAWAAVGAARTGAEVVLVDKGYVGASGVTAPLPDLSTVESLIQPPLLGAPGRS